MTNSEVHHSQEKQMLKGPNWVFGFYKNLIRSKVNPKLKNLMNCPKLIERLSKETEDFAEICDSQIIGMNSDHTDINMMSYFSTIDRYFSYKPDVPIYALMLFSFIVINKTLKFEPSKGYKVFAGCIILAQKFIEDKPLSLGKLTEILCFPLKTLKELELFLFSKGLKYQIFRIKFMKFKELVFQYEEDKVLSF